MAQPSPVQPRPTHPMPTTAFHSHPTHHTTTRIHSLCKQPCACITISHASGHSNRQMCCHTHYMRYALMWCVSRHQLPMPHIYKEHVSCGYWENGYSAMAASMRFFSFDCFLLVDHGRLKTNVLPHYMRYALMWCVSPHQLPMPCIWRTCEMWVLGEWL